MLDTLTQRLSRVVKTLRGEARLTDVNIADALREVRQALLEADVALPVVKDFVAAVKDKAVGEEVMGSLTPGQALVAVVHRELAALMGVAAAPLDLATQPPAVILLAGLQGSGKTTTAAKLARLLKLDKKKVLVHRRTCIAPRRSSSWRRSPGRWAWISSRPRPGKRPSRLRPARSTGRVGTTTML
jgi:signal recognition particle subunit SRP54